jgi:hypothetical protein
MSNEYTIIGKLSSSTNDIKVECDSYAQMEAHMNRLLTQGYALIINRKPTQAEREACFCF